MHALGIDLGTTYTAAAWWEGGRAEPVALGERAHIVPSMVYVGDEGLVVGEAAARHAVTAPDRVAREFKRRFGDEVPVVLGGIELTRSQLTAEQLRSVLRKAEERLGEPPAYVVVTVPADWDVFKRDTMLSVALACGLAEEQVSLLPEPAAAGIYYASVNRVSVGDLLAVYDLGGGTFDTTVLRKTASGFEIVGTPTGHDSIGGADLDDLLYDFVGQRVPTAVREVDRADPHTRRLLAQLRAAVVDAKEALSAEPAVSIPVVLPAWSGELTVTRADFDGLIGTMLEATLDVLVRGVRAAGVGPGDLATVLLVGGSSRIPLVSRLIVDALGVPVSVDAHPKFAVCLGAAIAAGARLEATRWEPAPVAVGSEAGAPTIAPDVPKPHEEAPKPPRYVLPWMEQEEIEPSPTLLSRTEGTDPNFRYVLPWQEQPSPTDEESTVLGLPETVAQVKPVEPTIDDSLDTRGGAVGGLPATDEAAPVVEVDLVAMELVDASVVPTRPAVDVRRQRIRPTTDEPVVIETRPPGEPREPLPWQPFAVIGAVVLLVVAFLVFAQFR